MLMTACLNMGNDANRHALRASSYQFSEEQLGALAAQLSATAWDALQDIWDTVNSLYPDLKKTMREESSKRTGLAASKASLSRRWAKERCSFLRVATSCCVNVPTVILPSAILIYSNLPL